MYLKMSSSDTNPQGVTFLELRRKIQDAEVLSSSVERLLKSLGFTGRLTVVVQNGRVLKSGYEEGYFTRRWDDRPV
jgi:sulfur carrier protein ThiS